MPSTPNPGRLDIGLFTQAELREPLLDLGLTVEEEAKLLQVLDLLLDQSINYHSL